MREVSEHWIMDADIFVDYQARAVKFEKREKIVTRKNIGLLVLFPLLYTFGLLFIADFYLWTSHSNLIPLQFWVSIGFLLFLFSVIFEFIMILIPQFQSTRNLWFKFQRPRRTVTIQNPKGNIEISSKKSEPFFDLEFTDDVSRKLNKVSLIKERITPKKRFIFKRTITKLLITFTEQTEGEITIKEY